MKPDIYELFHAFTNRLAWRHFQSVLSISLEDGSGKKFNVSGYVSGITEPVTRFYDLS